MLSMTATDIAAGPLSELEHRVQLRRAVIASTIGTTIEWYDFFLYSTVTGLVFAKLYFPESDPLVGTLQAFAIYAVGFCRPSGRGGDLRPLRRSPRTQSGADRDPVADGHRNLSRRVRAYLRADRHLGRDLADRPALYPRGRRRRRMGRLGADVDGMGAIRPPSRFYCCLAAIWRPVRSVPGEFGGAGVQRDLGRPVLGLGMAHSIFSQHPPGRGRALYPARHPGDAHLFTPRRGKPCRKSTGTRSH